MGTRWRGLLAPLGVSTGDGRRFLASGVTSRELPLPLKWQRTDEGGHDASVVVGMCDTLDISDDAVWGEGELFDDVDPAEMPRLAEDVAEAKLLTSKKVVGPSVDPGSCAYVLAEVGSDEPISEERLDEMFMEAYETGVEPALEILFTEYEIAAATLVTVPAFGECRPFELLEGVEAAALTAAVRATGWSDMPLADRDAGWNSADADMRVANSCGIGGDSPDWECYAEAFLYKDDNANPETKGAYKLGIVDVVNDRKMIIPHGVFAVAAVLQGSRGGANIPEDDQARMREVLTTIYNRMADEFDDDSIVAPWAADTAAIRRAMTAAAPCPPATLFEDPQLDELTPLTIVEVDGWKHVFGHVATHDTCHVGIRDGCTTAPFSAQDYGFFHRYTQTADGTRLPVAAGRLTAGHGQFTGACSCCRGNDDHACDRLLMAAAIAQHDKMRPVAYVRSGEDATNNAIWFSGIVAPDVTDADLRVLQRRKISADWREAAGNLEMVEILVLNRAKPGFPLPRARMAEGQPLSLVAAGTVRPPGRGPAPAVAGLDYDRLGASVAAHLAARVAGLPASSAVGVTAADGMMPMDHLMVGERVQVRGEPHEPGQDTGTVAIVHGGPAYGVTFDTTDGGEEDPGEGAGEVYKWYVGDELAAVDAAPAEDDAMSAGTTAVSTLAAETTDYLDTILRGERAARAAALIAEISNV